MKGDKDIRLIRLLQVLYILTGNPQGIEPEKIAEQCDVSTRTIFRDRRDLEKLIGPILIEKGRWKIEPGSFLPPISFTLMEAMTIFIAARLMLGYSNAYNPSIASTLLKLNSIVPMTLKDQVRHTIEWMQKQKRDERFLRNLEALARAWTEGRQAKIWYQSLEKAEPEERIIDVYFIQPMAQEHATYVIAYCHRANEKRIFKLERIKSIELTNDHYTIPESFDPNELLGAGWGIMVYGKAETIKLRFSPEIARVAGETTWHLTQDVRPELGGSIIVIMKVPITVQLEGFILSWGENVEVLEPKELRERVARTAREIADMYKKK